MNVTQTPDSISPEVLALCHQIVPNVHPVYIDITTEPGSEVQDCFGNVQRKVASDGGQIQFGWSIWEWPGVYVEAEHHAVYEPLQGTSWLDITPASSANIERRLFLPDDNAVYSFENEGVRVDNKRLALNDDPLIQQFFAAAEHEAAIWNSIPGVGTITLDPNTALALDSAKRQKALSFLALLMKYTSENAPCFCGSGQKFRRCHGE